MNTLVDHWPLALVLAILSTQLLAATRNAAFKALAAVGSVPANQGDRIAEAAGRGATHVGRVITKLMNALVSGAPNADSSTGIWSMLMPGVFAVLAVALLASDFVVLGLRMAALLGIPPSDWLRDAPLDLLLAGMFTATAVVWGLALIETASSNEAQPWCRLDDEWRRRTSLAARWGLVLTFAAVLALWTWGGFQSSEADAPSEVVDTIPLLVWAMMAIPVLGATAVAIAASIPGFLVIAAAVLLGMRLALVACQGAFLALAAAIEDLLHFTMRVVDVPATLGKGLWNWVVEVSGMQQKLKLQKIQFDELPVVRTYRAKLMQQETKVKEFTTIPGPQLEPQLGQRGPSGDGHAEQEALAATRGVDSFWGY